MTVPCVVNSNARQQGNQVSHFDHVGIDLDLSFIVPTRRYESPFFLKQMKFGEKNYRNERSDASHRAVVGQFGI